MNNDVNLSQFEAKFQQELVERQQQSNQQQQNANGGQVYIPNTELDVQIATAKRYPRDIEVSLADASNMITSSKQIAESCNYSLPRKQQDGKIKYINGPSIRLAEIIAQSWGNLHAGIRFLPSEDSKTIIAEAMIWDLEKNNRFPAIIKRSIVTKTGKLYSQDMQTMTANAATAIAFRNAIFKAIPRAAIDQLHKIALDFISNNDKLGEQIPRVLNYFMGAGYTKEHILKFLDRKTEKEITKDDIIKLSGIKNRIDDGQLAANESLPLTEDDLATETKNDANVFFGENQ